MSRSNASNGHPPEPPSRQATHARQPDAAHEDIVDACGSGRRRVSVPANSSGPTTAGRSSESWNHFTSLQRSILMTVAYADLFDFPLTIHELCERLVGETAGRDRVRAAVQSLSGSRLVIVDGYVVAAGREHLVAVRRTRKKHANDLWPVAARYARWLERVPFVRMVAVSGSLAVDNSGARSDVDLFCITDADRLWLARLFIVPLSRLTRLLPRFFPFYLCPNYLLARDALEISDRNLFTAYEIVQSTPLWGHAVHVEFLEHNRWVKELLPNVPGLSTSGVSTSGVSSSGVSSSGVSSSGVSSSRESRSRVSRSSVSTSGVSTSRESRSRVSTPAASSGSASASGVPASGGPASGTSDRRGLERLLGGRLGRLLNEASYRLFVRFYRRRARTKRWAWHCLQTAYQKNRYTIPEGGYADVVGRLFRRRICDVAVTDVPARELDRLFPLPASGETHYDWSRLFELEYGESVTARAASSATSPSEGKPGRPS